MRLHCLVNDTRPPNIFLPLKKYSYEGRDMEEIEMTRPEVRQLRKEVKLLRKVKSLKKKTSEKSLPSTVSITYYNAYCPEENSHNTLSLINEVFYVY